MAQKIIGFYSEDTHAGNKRLVVEISHHQFACLVRNIETEETEAFELFQLDEAQHEWNDVFYEIRQYSMLLNKPCNETCLFYNFEESMLIPAGQKNIVAAEDHLSLLFGESEQHELKYDKIGRKEQLINAYRIRRSIHELAGRYFPSHRAHHAYTNFTEEVLLHHEHEEQYLRLQFYSNHFVLALIKEKKLQLLQGFSYHTTEDVLYHVLNVAKQFSLTTKETPLEISGLFDRDTDLHRQLKQLFPVISFDEIIAGNILSQIIEAGYPAHYFTPFFKLADHEDHIG